MDTFRTMIVAAAIAPQVRALADTWPLGTGMFVVPLYTGAEVTHYISTGMISATIAGWMPYTDTDGTEYPGDIPALVDAINEDNPEASATVEMITTLLAESDISTEDWPVAIARLGLTQEPA